MPQQGAEMPPLHVEITKVASCVDSAKATAGDKLTVHYSGFLVDGKKFDSSHDRHKPFTFDLGAGQVIPGWDQGLVGVCPGEERHLMVPSALAYGDRGAGDAIPPGATLLFDIMIINVEKNPAAGQARAQEGAPPQQQQQQREGRQQFEAQTPSTPAPAAPAASAPATPSPAPPTPTSCADDNELRMRIVSQPPTCDRRAKHGDKLAMHYTGTLLDGTKFDSSLDRGKPFEFTLGVGQVIQVRTHTVIVSGHAF
jgi:FKBP-type peptidyl-prolyl cis-trans isomerase